MMAACRRSFVHGPLLLLRYTLSGLPWGAMLAASPVTGGGGEEGAEEGPAVRLGCWVERMLGLLEQVMRGQKGAGGRERGLGGGGGGGREGWEGAARAGRSQRWGSQLQVEGGGLSRTCNRRFPFCPGIALLTLWFRSPDHLS